MVKIEEGHIDFVDDLANIVPAVLTLAMLGIPLKKWAIYSEPVHASVYTPEHSPDIDRVVAGHRQMGLDLLTKALAYEMAPDGITVNAIAPGVIETALTRNSLADSAIANWIVDCVPAGRIGRPEDIAAVAAFLASDDAEYVTGISVPVDGGFTLGWFRKPVHDDHVMAPSPELEVAR